MNKETVLQHLQSGALMLCVNQRLARYWLSHYEQWQQQCGKLAWSTPNIHALEHWVQQQYRVHAFQQAILNPKQEKVLWQAIIEQDIGESLLDSRSMAIRAQSAYELLHIYQISLSTLSSDSHEVQCFQSWAATFKTRLKKMQALVAAQLSGQMSELIAQQAYVVSSQVIWAGFDDLNPANQALLNSIQQHSKVLVLQNEQHLSQTEVWQCYDEESELRRVCARIRQLYPQKQHIAVLVPDMQRRKQHISRVFHAELSPTSVLLQNEGEAAFNLSLGSALIRQPMIRYIFLLLRCCHHSNLQFEHMSALLLSPYLFPREREGRAALEQHLRLENMESFRLKQLLQWPIFVKYARTTQAAFVKLQALKIARQQFASEWVEYLNQVLDIFALQKNIQLSSEKAQWRNWLQVCDEVSALDDVLGSIPFLNFLHVLQQHCAEQPFRPDPSQSSIQVMGMLEASGMTFDHVFIIGMHETAWPTQAKPQPLLPLSLQRQHQMPHADAQREFDYANQVWQNIMNSSEHIEISYALISDGQETRPSCLLQDIPMQIYSSLETAQWQAQLFQTQAHMLDVQSRPLPPNPQENIRGGASLLHAQARCAFKAFAQFRLQIQALATKPHAGFNPLQRGNLLHEVLNQFWSDTKDWQSLKQLFDEQSLKNTLQKCIEKVLAQQALKAHVLHQQFEQQRLLYILEQWLLLELERPPFTVMACEQAYDIHLKLPNDCQQSSLALRVKIDRIDEDAQGNIILLDYKTGRVELQGILQEPLMEPQLPLYLQVDALQQADAVVFASIRADDKGPHFTGISRSDEMLPQVSAQPDSWETQLAQWKNSIQGLAGDFFHGDTRAQPHSKQDCSYCQMQRLCRV